MRKNTMAIIGAVLLASVWAVTLNASQANAKAVAKSAKSTRQAVSASSSSSGSTQYADGTTVTRNADGTVDVSDTPTPVDGISAPSGSAASYATDSARGPGRVVARQVRSGNTHYADGVTVRRNADGSIDVSDPPTIEHWGASEAAAPVVHHRAKAKAVKRHK